MPNNVVGTGNIVANKINEKSHLFRAYILVKEREMSKINQLSKYMLRKKSKCVGSCNEFLTHSIHLFNSVVQIL